MLKMLITRGEILRFPRYRGWGMFNVTSGVAWCPVNHMCVRVSDLWRGMVSRKSVTCV